MAGGKKRTLLSLKKRLSAAFIDFRRQPQLLFGRLAFNEMKFVWCVLCELFIVLDKVLIIEVAAFKRDLHPIPFRVSIFDIVCFREADDLLIHFRIYACAFIELSGKLFWR